MVTDMSGRVTGAWNSIISVFVLNVKDLKTK